MIYDFCRKYDCSKQILLRTFPPPHPFQIFKFFLIEHLKLYSCQISPSLPEFLLNSHPRKIKKTVGWAGKTFH